VLAVRHHQREQEVVPVLQYGIPEDVAEDRTRGIADGLLVGTPEQVTIWATITSTTPGIIAALLTDPRTDDDTAYGNLANAPMWSLQHPLFCAPALVAVIREVRQRASQALRACCCYLAYRAGESQRSMQFRSSSMSIGLVM
jgi:hypothetical protein